MITRRFVLTGFVATAGVATASQLLPVEFPKPYATVYGVGWDLEVVEYDVWTPQDALQFAKFGYGTGIDLFREITDIVYNVPMEPLPININSNFRTDPVDPLDRFRWNPTFGPPFTNKAGREWDGKSTKYFTVDIEERRLHCRDENDIWYFDRPAKEDEKPYWA